MREIKRYIIQNTGKSHLQRRKICQDAAYLKVLDNGYTIAAVSDGVGSCERADIGAKIACEEAVKFCFDNMPVQYTEKDILSLMRIAYNHALRSIFEYADQEEVHVDELDTTLTLAIFDGSTCYYGQAGDSMIIGLTSYGEYLPITKRQKGEDFTSVRPLRAGSESWKFGKTHQDFVAIGIMSDGVYDLLTPPLIQKIAEEDILYSLGAILLLDPRIIDYYDSDQYISMVKQYISGDLEENIYYDIIRKILKETPNKEELIQKIKKYNMPLQLFKKAQDDQTIVILSSSLSHQEIDQLSSIEYKEPDWEELLKKQQSILYPHCKSKQNENVDQGSEDQSKKFSVMIKESAEIIKMLISKYE